jgi:protein TonB
MAATDPQRGRAVQIAIWVGIALLALALLAWGVRGMIGGKAEAPKKPPKISLLPDKPPPPPPPPKEKPEPPKADEKQVKAEPPKEPQPQARNEPLKMEGAAGDGPSAFAAGTVSKEYIGGAVGSGGIGGGRMQHGFFVDRLQRYLQEELNRNRKLRETDYRITLRLWIARDGSMQRVELTQSTGNAEVDALLKQTLLQIAAIRETPPESLPQPIRIRVTARGNT